jgi:hypothetical protein
MDGARVFSNGTTDGLTNPLRGVSAETIATPVIEFLRGTHEADITLLNDVQQRHYFFWRALFSPPLQGLHYAYDRL